MARSLVIVESPAKARTINRYLGKEYLVKSSVGHIRDLPAGGKAKESSARRKGAGSRKTAGKRPADPQVRARRRLVQRMGVDPDRGWRATYEVVPGKEKVVGELKKLAGASGNVFLATDLDREGEAIAWHLKEVIGGDPARFRRVVFNEITRRAIRDAFEHPGDIDQNRVNAQQARHHGGGGGALGRHLRGAARHVVHRQRPGPLAGPRHRARVSVGRLRPRPPVLVGHGDRDPRIAGHGHAGAPRPASARMPRWAWFTPACSRSASPSSPPPAASRWT